MKHECNLQNLTDILAVDENSADNPQYAALLAHVDECDVCQQHLNRLGGEVAAWDEVRSTLSAQIETHIPHRLNVDTIVGDVFAAPSVAELSALLDPPRHPEMIGSLGKYGVDREIGRGGMSVVVRGFDSELNRPVAIKILLPHLAGSGVARQRFIRGARAAAAVAHDHVVPIHGIETSGRYPAIVMPLIAGPSLQELVDRDGIPDIVDVVRISHQIADGLAAAHAQGLVHRDIKPANILLENGLNRIQITDFGLARTAHDANLTHSGHIAGTPNFMSPEQASDGAIDHRSDLFSLGCVLYFLCTGEYPFTATTPFGVLQKVVAATPPRVRSLNPQVPVPLERVIEKLLAKSADDRFQTAGELHQYLGELLAWLQQPTNHRPPKTLRVAPQARRKRLATILAGFGLIGAFVAGWFAIDWMRSEPAPTTQTVSGTAGNKSPDTSAKTSLDSSIAISPLEEIDQEIATVARLISAMETAQSMTGSSRHSGVYEKTQTPLSGGLASFDEEVQSLGAALRRLESESF